MTALARFSMPDEATGPAVYGDPEPERQVKVTLNYVPLDPIADKNLPYIDRRIRGEV